jgi:hypothetical protein
MLDNIERVDSDWRGSDRDTLAWYAGLEAEAIAAQAHEDAVQAVLTAIGKLGASITPADLDQLLASLASSIGHLPKQQELVDLCFGQVECCS